MALRRVDGAARRADGNLGQEPPALVAIAFVVSLAVGMFAGWVFAVFGALIYLRARFEVADVRAAIHKDSESQEYALFTNDFIAFGRPILVWLAARLYGEAMDSAAYMAFENRGTAPSSK